MSKTPYIVAFDCADMASATRLAEQLSPTLCRAKVGKELFTACGMTVVDMLHHKGYEVFLDLKFHDIPNTVAGALRVAARAGVWMVNVHASGGVRMMSAAREALQHSRTHLIAVTVLTSMTEQDLQLLALSRNLSQQVLALAEASREAGLQGVVCSAQEAALLRQHCGENFLLVTPGIRLASGADTSGVDDQRRILTPSQAMAAGSDYVVVGRPLTQSTDPGVALQQWCDQLAVPPS